MEATILRLASAAALFGEDAPVSSGAGGNPMDLLSVVFPFVAIFGLFYFLMIRPQRREQAKHQALLADLKKNDRVVTSGGIFGVVTNVNREANEVTIKVDETTNTKLRVTLSSIARVMSDESSDATPNT